MQWSPDGRFAAFFNGGQWHAVDARSGKVRTLTAGLGVSFADEEDDTPDPPGSYGSAGWTKGGLSFLAYDRYDVWQLFVDGSPAKNVTEGEGRKARLEFRVQVIEPADEDDEDRGIDPAKPLTLRAESEETRATGFYKDSLVGVGLPQRVLWGDRNFRYAGRAKTADVLLVTASRFDEYPDLHVTDASFKAPVKMSDGGSQTQPFLWGKGELQAVVDRGFVDENAIGIQGHSWGGYQIAYMVTQTSRFKAAEAGAPVGNMTSAYSGIRWGSGQPRQFQYEQTQSRIGPSLYDAPLKYVENSAIFQVKRVTTPLLILHDDQDDAVPWYQGIELFLALRRNGKTAYLFNCNGELHGLRRRHNQKDYAVRMQQFFDHFLKGAPKPEWMEKGIPFVDREEEKERFLKAAYDK
jgi:dienelactone hydrolase